MKKFHLNFRFFIVVSLITGVIGFASRAKARCVTAHHGGDHETWRHRSRGSDIDSWGGERQHPYDALRGRPAARAGKEHSASSRVSHAIRAAHQLRR